MADRREGESKELRKSRQEEEERGRANGETRRDKLETRYCRMRGPPGKVRYGQSTPCATAILEVEM